MGRNSVSGLAFSKLSIGALVTRCRVVEGPARGLSCFDSVEALGNLEILKENAIALFCSTACPGGALLEALDRARELRDGGATVISGFHSPVERECLKILLRGSQPVIICPARELAGMRVPAEWKGPLQGGRLLVLSPFHVGKRRVSARQAEIRNEFVLALAREVWFAHVVPGGHTARLAERAAEWKKGLLSSMDAIFVAQHPHG